MTTDRRYALQRSRRRTVVAVYGVAAATFALVAGGLGLGMARGHDPALGPASADSAAAAERRVVIRRIVTTHRIHAAPGAVASPPGTEAETEPAPTPVDTATS